MKKLTAFALATTLGLAFGACTEPVDSEDQDADIVDPPDDAPPMLTKEQCQTMYSSVHRVNLTCGRISPPMTFTGETFLCTSEVGLLPADPTKCAIKCTGVFGWRDLTNPAAISIQADGLHFTMEDPPKPWGCRPR